MTKKCKNCDESADDTGFCSQWCLELWVSREQARILTNAFNKILDEHFQLQDKDANTRPSK